MKCPTHGLELTPTRTRFGVRRDCPILDCDVMCWDGQTSTPANKATRDARINAHAVFDALPMRRAQRYKWLQDIMNLPASQAHIGMFTEEQCHKVIEAVQEAMKPKRKR